MIKKNKINHDKFWFCPRVPVHKSRYKGPNNTQQLTNDSQTKKEQWLFPCEPIHQDRTQILLYELHL